MQLIKIEFNSNAREYSRWIGEVPEKIQLQVEEKLPRVKRNTKKEVQEHLTNDFGIGIGKKRGTYKKSFTVNDYSQTKWQVAFQVYAGKGHHRLTHLLEGGSPPMYGHQTILFRWGKGKPTTKKGVIGMSHVYETKLHYKKHHHIIGYTGLVRHIEPGQDYAEEQLPILYDEGINRTLKERMKRIK